MERARRIASRAMLSRLVHQAKHSPIPHHHPHHLSSARYVSSLAPSIFPSRSQLLPSRGSPVPPLQICCSITRLLLRLPSGASGDPFRWSRSSPPTPSSGGTTPPRPRSR